MMDIDHVSDLKFLDFIQDEIIRELWKHESDPVAYLEKWKVRAIEKCMYDDPTIDPALYAQINAEITRKITSFFNQITEKLHNQTDDLG